jgi:subtilisin family serine protease
MKFITIFFLTILIPQLVLAEVKVYNNEYVLTPKKGVGAMSSKKLPGTFKVKSQNEGMILVKAKPLGMHISVNDEPEVVTYDPEKSRCKDVDQSQFDCWPNYYVQVSAGPNDPSLSNLWGMVADKGIGANAAWNYSHGCGNGLVAVIDTGIDYNHPDLASNVWTPPNEIAGNFIDDDGNGFKDDVRGWNYWSYNNNPMDDNGHGTHVAGTIGAVGNNGVGVIGVNWNCKILSLKFLGANGGGAIYNAVLAVKYVIKMKKIYNIPFVVINNSYGGGDYFGPMFEVIKEAAQNDILFVVAAGNDGKNNDTDPSYPSNYDSWNVISVASIDPSGKLSSFSNYGSSVNLAAPGRDILSTWPGNTYNTISGTSMATPHVTGALALYYGANKLPPNVILDRMLERVTTLAGLNTKVETGGTLNAYNMFLSANPITCKEKKLDKCFVRCSKRFPNADKKTKDRFAKRVCRENCRTENNCPKVDE